MFQTQKSKMFFSLAIIYSIFLSFCCYCTDKNMLFTNITMRRIACFLRESTNNFSSLAIIYGFFLSFWFSGRYNSPRTKYWEELYVSDAKIQTFRVARKSFKGFFLIFCCYWIDKNRVFTNKTVRRIACFRRESTKIWLARNQLWVFLEFLLFFLVGITSHEQNIEKIACFRRKKKSACSQSLIASVVIVPTKICYLPTKQWEESHVSDAKVQKLGSHRSALATISGYISSFWFPGRYNEQDQVSRVLQTQGHNFTDKRWFINKILRRIVCFQRKYKKFGSLAIIYIFSSFQLVGINRH